MIGRPDACRCRSRRDRSTRGATPGHRELQTLDADLEVIADDIALEHPTAASALVQRIVDHVEQLAEHPECGTRFAEMRQSRYRQRVQAHCRVFYRYGMRMERLLRNSQLAQGRPAKL